VLLDRKRPSLAALCVDKLGSARAIRRELLLLQKMQAPDGARIFTILMAQ
jgi:hypothetical protein